MIISTEDGVDIPACYSKWFYNRIKEGYILTRNSCRPRQVTRYFLNPSVVDCLAFCTKNPEPMLERLSEIRQFGQLWEVTASPYGKEIEPDAPDKSRVLRAMQELSGQLGIQSVSWRYAPVFLNETYTLEFHIRAFERMAHKLQGYVDRCVVSFAAICEQERRDLSGVQMVPMWAQAELISVFAEIGSVHGIKICCENHELARYGAETEGCVLIRAIERAIGCRLAVPSGRAVVLGRDTEKGGMYHDPASPFLFGVGRPGDIIEDAKQYSWKSPICYSHLSADMI